MFISKCSKDNLLYLWCTGQVTSHYYKSPGSRAGSENLWHGWSCTTVPCQACCFLHLEQSMWFCSVIFYLAPLNYPGGCQRPASLLGMDPVPVFFASFRRVEWPGSFLIISQPVPSYRLCVHMPSTWESSFCLDLGWQFENWSEPLCLCLAFDHLSWEDCPALTSSPCPFLCLFNFFSLQFPSVLFLQTCSWASVPRETLQMLAGQTLYSPRKVSILQASLTQYSSTEATSSHSMAGSPGMCLTSRRRSHALSWDNKIGCESAIVTLVIRRYNTQFSLQLNNLAPILNKWWTR